jgi:hypothetical protein
LSPLFGNVCHHFWNCCLSFGQPTEIDMSIKHRSKSPGHVCWRSPATAASVQCSPGLLLSSGGRNPICLPRGLDSH